MTNRLDLRRSPWQDKEFLEATSSEGVTACCYVEPGTPAFAAIEEGHIVVIRAEDDDNTLLAEAHPKR
jgi:hypothetical protein